MTKQQKIELSEKIINYLLIEEMIIKTMTNCDINPMSKEFTNEIQRRGLIRDGYF